jgi:hypothetical protein
MSQLLAVAMLSAPSKIPVSPKVETSIAGGKGTIKLTNFLIGSMKNDA